MTNKLAMAAVVSYHLLLENLRISVQFPCLCRQNCGLVVMIGWQVVEWFAKATGFYFLVVCEMEALLTSASSSNAEL